MKHLAFFIHSMGGGGAERVTANLANHWANCGWDVTIITLAPRCHDFYQLHPAVRRIALDLAGESGNALAGVVANLRRVSALRRTLRQLQPDVTLGIMSTANVLLALAGCGLGIRLIGSERVHPPQLPLKRVWELLRRHSYCLLDSVTALTDESARWIKQNTRARCVRVIPNAVLWPLPLQEPIVNSRTFLTPSCKYMLAVGRLENQKGFDLLLTAFVPLARRHPDWKLLILGEGPLRQSLTQQISLAGLLGRVLLPGRVGNVGDWYACVDIYVMSSRFEGFPNTLAEALAHGLPAVSFDCNTGPRDIIRHEVDGLMVPPGDVVALTASLDRLMGDVTLRQRFSMRAVEASDRFSMERITALWEQLFNEVSRGKK